METTGFKSSRSKRKLWTLLLFGGSLKSSLAKELLPGEVATAAVTAAYVDGKCLVDIEQKARTRRQVHGKVARCLTRFEYKPHRIEQEWIRRAEDPEVDTCEYHRLHPEDREADLIWINAARALSNLSPNTNAVAISEESNLSSFAFHRLCMEGHNITREQWTEWIEPLVGFTRHPFSLCHPLHFELPEYLNASIFDIDYFILHSNTKESQARRTSEVGKNYLFDIGSNYFHTSLGSLLCKYSTVGVGFDKIFAWEAETLNQQSYWDGVPKMLHRRVHFYNVPVSADTMKPGEPLALVTKMAKKDDFVVIKLDIDTPEIEMSIVHSILNHEGLSELIDEFFFEYHYESPIMAQYWGHTGEKNLSGALLLFQELRRKGIRAHFWP
mmetsp:Transcript_10915/g.67427  ORF Transcript_10915/g.67427 Transcript_10915/m.67427 type:complete len:384 (-) Transcript_10915:4391-5542(-)